MKFVTLIKSFITLCVIIVISGCAGFYMNGISVSRDGRVVLCLDKEKKYETITTTSSDIFLTDITGSFLKQLTDDEDTDVYVQWSPKGDKFLFVSKHKEGEEKDKEKTSWTPYLVDKNGENKTLLIQKDREISFPTWSPDGLKIVYYGYDSSAERDCLYLFDLAKGQEEELMQGIKHSTFLPTFRWSKDASKLLILRNKSKDDAEDIFHGEVCIFNLEDEGSRVLFEGIFSLFSFIDWYNHESQIIFSAYKAPVSKESAEKNPPAIFLFDLETGTIRETPEFENLALFATWSTNPEGFFVLKDKPLDEDWSSELFKQNTVIPLDDPSRRSFQINGYPFWISDDKIGFIEQKKPDEKTEECILWIMERTGKDKLNLTEEIKK